jgi:hypothetical protein
MPLPIKPKLSHSHHLHHAMVHVKVCADIYSSRLLLRNYKVFMSVTTASAWLLRMISHMRQHAVYGALK